MSGHLCLKWNNHSTSFLKSISNIQSKNRYCDATITCQGKYFPVHRIVLSTCSDYFEEMFERIQNQHPYIVFRDIDPREMELLLNYMYQGEVNVLQDNLPTFIKAAEALRIKGLAVPDDLPSKDQTSGKKRSNTFSENSQPKRRAEERRRRRDSTENNDKPSYLMEDGLKHSSDRDIDSASEQKDIKEEPLDTGYEDNTFQSTVPSNINESSTMGNSESDYLNFNESEKSIYVKNENTPQDVSYENKPSSWGEAPYEIEDQLGNLSSTNVQEDIFGTKQLPNTTLLSNAKPNKAANLGTKPHVSSHLLFEPISRCSFCPFRCLTSEELEIHVMSSHSEERPYACNMCPMRFTQKNNLVIHTRIHTGEKPYKCIHCGSKFRHSNSLTRHMHKKVQCNKLMSLNQHQQQM